MLLGVTLQTRNPKHHKGKGKSTISKETTDTFHMKWTIFFPSLIIFPKLQFCHKNENTHMRFVLTTGCTLTSVFCEWESVKRSSSRRKWVCVKLNGQKGLSFETCVSSRHKWFETSNTFLHEKTTIVLVFSKKSHRNHFIDEDLKRNDDHHENKHRFPNKHVFLFSIFVCEWSFVILKTKRL